MFLSGLYSWKFPTDSSDLNPDKFLTKPVVEIVVDISLRKISIYIWSSENIFTKTMIVEKFANGPRLSKIVVIFHSY